MSKQAKSYDPTTLGQAPQDEPGTLRDDEGNVLPTFDSKHEQAFTGLLYLGALTDDFTWLGHDFSIRTLRDGEKLAVARIIKPYADTMGIERAYACATAAMAVTSVDGEDLPIPIGEPRKAQEWGLQRFEYVANNWFSYTTDVVFERYVALDDLARQVVEAMGKALAPEVSNPSSNDI